MPHKSIQAAEKAAIEGETEQWDTQQCRALNVELEALLTSSPTRSSGNQVASAIARVAIPSSPQQPVENHEQEDSQVVVALDAYEEPNAVADSPANGDGNPDELRQLDQPATANDDLKPRPDEIQGPLQIRRDSLGRLRAYTAAGEEVSPAQFIKKYQMAQAQAAMDDFTQRSSMSATQENPQYLYEQFQMQRMNREDCPSTSIPNDDSESEDQGPEPPVHDPRHASASTAYTYQENDTGHIHLGFDTEPIEEEPLEESQDGSYTMPMPVVHPNYSSFEPKTPAPPVNPFRQKGSVMEGFELFGATQPSSIGRHMAATPTSSRPSPDVYNDFSSPPKHPAPELSSPLRRGLPEPDSDMNDATPLQSSVRNMLGRSQLSRTAQSFDAGPKNAWANPEPRPYVSMQQSQEKRRRTVEPDFDSSDDESDMETPRNHNRKTERELQIQKELAKVELRKRTPSTNPRSSAPPSSTVAVEVPSTGRRRSVQEDYIAQCSGHDARDTQQDDVIVDSQAAETEIEEPEQLDSSKRPVETTESSVDHPRQGGEEVEQELDGEATQNTNSSNPEPALDLEPSLPLQEMSSNLGVRTPGSKIQSDAVDTVPETSPPEARLRPMGEIASLSFGASEDLPDNFPGFTQDLEFENAMQIRSSPRPPTRKRSLGRAPKSSMTSGTGSSMVNPVSSATSSALSSPPNSAVLEETAAEVNLHDEPSEDPKDKGIVRQDEVPIHDSDLQADPQTGSSVNTGSDPYAALNATPTTPATPTPADITQDQLQQNEVTAHSISSLPNEPTKQTPKRILRTYSKLRGPSRNLRRSLDTSATRSPQPSSRVAKMMPVPKTITSPQSTPVRKAVAKSKQPTPVVAPEAPSASIPTGTKRTNKRKSGVTVVQEDNIQPTRASKRQSLAKDSSPDPLALSSPSTAARTPKITSGLFKEMTFAVSYVAHEREKDEITKAIFEQGGRILPDGFDSLFDSAKGGENEELLLSPSAKSVGFVALIADEHSRKAKYMQALALGLPCISGHWITACVAKSTIVDWSPYLLCAGQSSILGNAHKSRVLAPYSAREAKLEDTFANRGKLLEGKSVLLVTGKGKGSEKRKAYTFLAHALGPARISQVADYQDARKKLNLDGEWDLLYVDAHEKAAEEAVFGTPTVSSSASRKRKRGPTAVDDSPAPKKIRIISDETMIQSLILGQLLED
ncbi:hypothetical protein ONS95_000731 [Cadophora gregata]|uniref:uncharacterized protein n=1 Tax=Cadophora gregata TaxID=51156 RepID=UPI0026DCBAD7|nr:uncharacterized protein ONS95_000731 [Cadophora gregata]KAK0128781.1 hypothetical protein ONS95_000731 [Cadophora gregata]